MYTVPRIMYLVHACYVALLGLSPGAGLCRVQIVRVCVRYKECGCWFVLGTKSAGAGVLKVQIVRVCVRYKECVCELV